MIRVLSYCHRFIGKCQKSNANTRALKIEKLNYTTMKVVTMTQRDTLTKDIGKVRDDKKLHDSKIINLNPFLNKHGILRVGSRLRNTHLYYDKKHPIILSSGSHLATLIIRDGHKQSLHGGTQLTLSVTRQKYWIINSKKTVKAKSTDVRLVFVTKHRQEVS
ncbi:hypothetical protein TcasGA2_TC031588 [Tribolium castaneum]|uniref:Integrase zinc-binding domain-containing protein n=1 Tax=Tribolium castaneum TaxID=7070 RepID=A0A139WA35_TRICA|nr:hypothetical protein TcasGA2_TC031588 [Tribolium castaneum]